MTSPEQGRAGAAFFAATSRLRVAVVGRALITALTTGLALGLSAPAWSEQGLRDIPFNPTPGSEPGVDLATEATLPEPMPALRPFDALRDFAVDSDTPNRFALDPESIRVQKPFVMVTVAAQSVSGAVTTGYYAYHCGTRQQRLMALPTADRQWQPSSSTARWRGILGTEGRNRQHVAVFSAVCRTGGLPVDSVDEMLFLLGAGRRTINP